MKIALIGYGKMGKAIEKLAQERGHEVILRIQRANLEELNASNLQKVDVAIEFTNPEAAVHNIRTCIQSKTPIVIGSTGWNHEFENIKGFCLENDGSMIAASNFSIGVNLFFELNRQLAKIMNQHPSYQANIEEIHHTEKKDAPSGTAISLAEDLMDQHDGYQNWSLAEKSDGKTLAINALREAGVPGTHEIKYANEIDEISIRHEAKNRSGFALGAILAAEYLQNHKGIFTMRDVLKL